LRKNEVEERDVERKHVEICKGGATAGHMVLTGWVIGFISS